MEIVPTRVWRRAPLLKRRVERGTDAATARQQLRPLVPALVPRKNKEVVVFEYEWEDGELAFAHVCAAIDALGKALTGVTLSRLSMQTGLRVCEIHTAAAEYTEARRETLEGVVEIDGIVLRSAYLALHFAATDAPGEIDRKLALAWAFIDDHLVRLFA